MTVNGTELGGEVSTSGRRGGDVAVSVRLRSNVPVDHLELVRNGNVVQEIALADDRRSASATVRVPVDRSGWLLLRARGDKAAYPTLDIFPYATTSPVYLTVGGRPARSPEDARYFMSWIDRMQAVGRGAPGLEQRRRATGDAGDAGPGPRGVRSGGAGAAVP